MPASGGDSGCHTSAEVFAEVIATDIDAGCACSRTVERASPRPTIWLWRYRSWRPSSTSPPRRSRIVLRPRLDERLDEGLQRRLTLVSAPAGFGKSTLVAEWVAECGMPVAWLSLDEGDGEPTGS